jgi:hypothetical protein
LSLYVCHSTEHEGGRYGRVKGKALKGCVSSTYFRQQGDRITKSIYRQCPRNDGLSRHSYTALNGKSEDAANVAHFGALGKRSQYTDQATGWTIRDSNSSMGKRSVSSQNVQTDLVDHPASHSMSTRVFLHGGKEAGTQG